MDASGQRALYCPLYPASFHSQKRFKRQRFSDLGFRYTPPGNFGLFVLLEFESSPAKREASLQFNGSLGPCTDPLSLPPLHQ